MATEVVFAAIRIHKARKQMTQGNIKKEQFMKIQKECWTVAGVSAAGSLVGATIGSIVPIAGTIIGSTVGSLIGNALGVVMAKNM